MRIGTIVGALAALYCTPSFASVGFLASSTQLDLLWIISATGLVFLMQVGFLLVEAGTVRSKNSISVAVRNMLDALIAIVLFSTLGFYAMYGVSLEGLLGIAPGVAGLTNAAPNVLAFFIYNIACCAIAATIFSGAVSERMSMFAYIASMVAIVCVIYPVFGHWAWGATLNSENQPLLASIGFYDFAGATVVHGVGAWVALAGAVVVGPRLGRYGADGRAVQVHGHSKVFTGVGLLLLLIGWIGFNGGAELHFNKQVPGILVITIIGGAAGGLWTTMSSFARFNQLYPDRLVTGVISGLVAVTAAANLLDPLGAAILGVLGAYANSLAGRFLAKARIDDVVGAVASHGFAGAVGTIGFVFLVPTESLPLKDMLSQAGVQTIGVAAAFVWAFSVAWLWLKAVNLIHPVRVSEEDEERGLNAAEHGAHLGAEKLADSVRELANGEADLSLRVKAEPGDDAYQLAQDFNKLLSMLEAKELARRHIDDQTRHREQEIRLKEWERAEQERENFEAERAAVQEISEFIVRAADGDLGSRLDLEGKAGVLAEVAEGVNRLIDGLSGSIGTIARSADSINGACSRLADVSADLRQRSAEQIDSVQHVTFSLSTMAEAADQSSNLAEDALGIAKETREVSNFVSDGVSRIEEAMQDIEKSAGAIVPVVEMIESIAFKTNLLAVNAAIEAARAGPAGRGFAIVSQEVRQLAGSAHEFADDIAEMVKSAMSAVHRGTSVVEETSGRINTVHVTAERVSEQINKIHSSSIAQRDKLNSLYDAVSSIADVSSGNARLAGDTASASAKLAEQGQNLVGSVQNFRGFIISEDETSDEADAEDGMEDTSIQLF